LLRNVGMTPAELKDRTKKFALDIINFTSGLPRGIATDVISRQLIRSGTGLARPAVAGCLLDEADQLTRIFVASIKTTRARMASEEKSKINPQSAIRNPQ